MNEVSSEKFYIYILYSHKDNNLYTGFTKDVQKRLIEHTTGKVQSTKHRRPLTLIHYEYFINIQDAKAREVFLKSGFGRSQMKKALQHTLHL